MEYGAVMEKLDVVKESVTAVMQTAQDQFQTQWGEYVNTFPYFSDVKGQMRWHRDHSEIPVFVIAVYLFFVFRAPGWMEKRKAFTLKVPLALWNLSLALFSWLGAIACLPILWTVIQQKGFRYSVCASPFDWDLVQTTGLFVGIFIYSKIPELLDTVFLILRKRQVIFLHWYHHVTVLLFCWQAWHMSVGYGIYFAAINYSVHALMYTYYFCTNIGLYPVVRYIAPFITAMQLSQMVVGLFVLGSVTYFHMTSTVDATPYGGVEGNGYHPDACYADSANLKLGFAMYFSYFLLFAEFFYDRYFGEKSSEHKAKAAPTKGAAAAKNVTKADKNK